MFVSTTNIIAQKIKLDCVENIYYQKFDNKLVLTKNDKEIEFSTPVNTSYNSCEISISCNSNYLNIIYTFQNGNDYKIVNNIFRFKDGFFYLGNIFTTYTDRYQTSLTGYIYTNIKLEDYSIKGDLFNKKFEEKNISSISRHQEEKEVDEIPYYNLIKKAFYKKKFSDIKLFTNEFVIDELEIEENLNVIDFNNVAFYAYKSKAYHESIYILNKIIQKHPTRVVAYLNIADNYWALNQKEKAIENYKKYLQLRKEQKKDLKKIPKYVYDRIKN